MKPRMQCPKLHIMVGIPGSGKSFYAKNKLSDLKYISRDEIRYSKNFDSENYFAHENEVYRDFIEEIIKSLKNNQNIVIDATHVSLASRKKLISAIQKNFSGEFEIIYYVVKTPLQICLDRNMHRIGVEKVPIPAIRRMLNSFVEPTFDEDKRIIKINYIYDDGRVESREKGEYNI